MKTNAAALTETEILTASQYVQAIREMIATKTLVVNGVLIKSLRRDNAIAICPPGMGSLVKRYLGGV